MMPRKPQSPDKFKAWLNRVDYISIQLKDFNDSEANREKMRIRSRKCYNTVDRRRQEGSAGETYRGTQSFRAIYDQ